MTKAQKKWFEIGRLDMFWAKEHPEALCQEAWGYFIKDIKRNLFTWAEVYEMFPFYKKGLLSAIKNINIVK